MAELFFVHNDHSKEAVVFSSFEFAKVPSSTDLGYTDNLCTACFLLGGVVQPPHHLGVSVPCRRVEGRVHPDQDLLHSAHCQMGMLGHRFIAKALGSFPRWKMASQNLLKF